MKKFLALILVLCMALAAIPAAAENDFTGTWYLIMLGMTGGTFELNADGTCAISVAADSEEHNVECTWSAEGDTVTLSVGEKSMVMTFDGTDMLLSEDAITAFGGGTVPAGTDLSALGSLIRLSREPGLITAAEYAAYTSDGTVPEGKTEEEMQQFQQQFMLTFLSLAGSMGSLSVGESGGEPASGPELTVLEENFYVRKGYGSDEAFYIAKIQNQNDAPLSISNSLLVLKDAEGNEIARKDYMGDSGSRYLESGEITFVTMYADLEEGVVPAAFEATFQTSDSPYATDTQVEISDVAMRIRESYWTSYELTASYTNTGDAPVSNIRAAIALRDAEGKLLTLVTPGLYPNELAPGSTITLVESVDGLTVDYITDNGVELGELEAYGWMEND